MSENKIGFRPRYAQEKFQAFFCTGKAWGILRQELGKDGVYHQSVEVIEGEALTLEETYA